MFVCNKRAVANHSVIVTDCRGRLIEAVSSHPLSVYYQLLQEDKEENVATRYKEKKKNSKEDKQGKE
jgi:hypothetical protein